jgi:TPR repeat protein
MMTFFSIKTTIIGLMISTSFLSPVNAETTQKQFQKAVIAKECNQIKRLLPKLLSENKFYFNTLANYYERGFCFPQNDSEAFKAYSQAPTTASSLPLFKMALMYAEGRGIEKNNDKSQDLIKRGLEYEVRRSYDFKGIRGSLEFLLNTQKFPEFLENELAKLEALETNPAKKMEFALDLIEKKDDLKDVKAGMNLLKNLAYQKNYTEAAYQLALIEYSNQNNKEGFMNLVSAAQEGHAKAQVMLGKLGLEGQKTHLSRASSYAMLLRAYSVGAISEQEVLNYKKKLSSHELKSAEREAAMPLPK